MLLDTNLLLFLTASLVVIGAPGPDNILVLTRGVSLGRKAALVSAASPRPRRHYICVSATRGTAPLRAI